uniref:Reverse transcriptase domain-containing protein n=1 Tax=Canis lupus familiaris TaxID=9615 RepID=A0A8P0PEB1_CANLF
MSCLNPIEGPCQLPTCPVPLLGRDILQKLRATIRLSPSPSASECLLLPLLPSPPTPIPTNLPTVNPQVWDTSKPTGTSHHSPVHIRLKNNSTYSSRAQFPISFTHRRGLKLIIDHLKQQGLLIPINSPCNTPILPVRKPSGVYRLVQDLQLINEAVVPLHPVVPNPYTLLSHIPPGTPHFTVLDLKDAFFTIPLHPDSYFLFAFTWEDPDTHVSGQLTWTVLPQGCCDSPHIFGQALAADLQECLLEASTLLQYVDDLLLCSPSLLTSQEDTSTLLNFLGARGYRVNPSKAQLCTPSVTYLGITLTPTSKSLTGDRIHLLQELPSECRWDTLLPRTRGVF